uniref:Uncharacterized protein AlNc14C45G3683 n=1 Tax=Albugo laibachii Nc14 TaxID=890382 RepID=F0WAF6_9STRA|nr:conserved hypothetical protein [Albugo laibachii Nc14]|eukprot:CCA18127.1 conserved hypothetical protein [Albugo laibachii Nc14]
MPLNAGDQITFGAKKTIIHVRWCSFNLVTSRLEKEQRKKVEEACQNLGMHLLPSNSRSVTHCIIESVGMVATEKILWALVYNQYVVTIAWLDAVIERSNLAIPLPKCENYTPVDNNDSEMMSKYLPNPARKNLFRDWLVIFLAPSSMEGMVREMGGLELSAYETTNMDYNEILAEKIGCDSVARHAVVVGSSSSCDRMTNVAKEPVNRAIESLSASGIHFTTQQELAEKVIFASPPSFGAEKEEQGNEYEIPPCNIWVDQSYNASSGQKNDNIADLRTQTKKKEVRYADFASAANVYSVDSLSENIVFQETLTTKYGEWIQTKKTYQDGKVSSDEKGPFQSNISSSRLVLHRAILSNPAFSVVVNYKRFKKGNSYEAHSAHSLFPVQTFVASSPHQALHIQIKQNDLEAFQQQERVADELFTMTEKRNVRKRL